MDTESSFSTPHKFADLNYHYILDNMTDIEEALIVEMPQDYLSTQSSDGEIDLFEDEKLI